MGLPKPPQTAPHTRAGVDPAGSVRVAMQALPFSNFASATARDVFKHRIDDAPATSEVGVLRAHYGRFNDALAQEMLAKYAVDVSLETMGGVSVQRVTSRGPRKPGRGLLINLHGGGFMWGAGSGALVEAIPIAVATDTPVVTVDYRMAPEHQFPAASQDASAVYEAALKQHAPDSIGIYGCSAGAALTAQTIAWLYKRTIPLPGAIAMLGGAGIEFGGDSNHLSAALMGSAPGSGAISFFDMPYMRDADRNDPAAIPERDNNLLAAFPPSLLITASRDFAASSVTQFHRRLVANGVDARLFMFDGLWHAFQIFCDLPESQETYRVMADFFTRTLRLAS